jgi:hypothetical protein
MLISTVTSLLAGFRKSMFQSLDDREIFRGVEGRQEQRAAGNLGDGE